MYTVMPSEWLFLFIFILTMWKGRLINSRRLQYVCMWTVSPHWHRHRSTARVLFLCCLFTDYLNVILLSHPGECVNGVSQRLVVSVVFWICITVLEAVEPKASSLLCVFHFSPHCLRWDEMIERAFHCDCVARKQLKSNIMGTKQGPRFFTLSCWHLQTLWRELNLESFIMHMRKS